MKTELPDIIGINEVKPKRTKSQLFPDEFNLERLGYDMFPNNIEEDNGRGQILYVSKKLKAKRVYFDSEFEEVTCAKIDLNNQDKLLVVLVYRSPSCTERNCEHLNQLVNAASDSNSSHLLMMGDFNYKFIDWETTFSEIAVEQTFLDNLVDKGLHQHVREPTRQRGRNEPSILDLVITKEESNVDEISYNSPLGKSDHSLLTFRFRCYADNCEEEEQEIWLYKKADYATMKEEFSLWDYEGEMRGKSTDERWEIFCTKYNQIVENNIPKVKRKKKFPVPLEGEIRKKIEEKDKLSRKLCELRKQKKWGEVDDVWKDYCKVRNKVRSLSRAARKDFESQIANEAKENPKKVFAYMNSKVKTKQGIGDICTDPENPKSSVTSNDQEKVNIFSKFFISVQVDEKDKSPEIEPKNINEQMPPLDMKRMRENVLKYLKCLKPNKKGGIDKQSPRVLREVAEEIVDVVLSIFDASLRNAEVPGDWLRAVIAVIFKKGKKSLVGNYRPVSLTCILCKVMEKVVRDHIIEHMKRNRLFSKKQYGFLAGRSVSLQLLFAHEGF